MKKKFRKFLDGKESLLNKKLDEIIYYFDRKPDFIDHNECIYVVEKYFFGMFERKLYLYFEKGVVVQYFIV